MKQKNQKLGGQIAPKIIAIASTLILLDQATKAFARSNFEKPLVLVENFFSLTLTENTGVAFGIKLPQTAVIFLGILLIFCLGYLAKKELNLANPLAHWACALILGGALGNFIDRIIQGFVTDFIAVWIWPVFNFADIFITIGVFTILVFYGRMKRI